MAQVKANIGNKDLTKGKERFEIMRHKKFTGMRMLQRSLVGISMIVSMASTLAPTHADEKHDEQYSNVVKLGSPCTFTLAEGFYIITNTVANSTVGGKVGSVTVKTGGNDTWATVAVCPKQQGCGGGKKTCENCKVSGHPKWQQFYEAVPVTFVFGEATIEGEPISFGPAKVSGEVGTEVWKISVEQEIDWGHPAKQVPFKMTLVGPLDAIQGDETKEGPANGEDTGARGHYFECPVSFTVHTAETVTSNQIEKIKFGQATCAISLSGNHWMKASNAFETYNASRHLIQRVPKIKRIPNKCPK